MVAFCIQVYIGNGYTAKKIELVMGKHERNASIMQNLYGTL